MKKYLIAGGAGFIGSNIVKKVLEKGDFVRVVDNFSTGRRENIAEFLGNKYFELMEADLTDFSVAKRAVGGIDFVLHQAALPSVPRSISDPIDTNNNNINATLNLLVAAKEEKVKKVVYASSSSIYGDNPELPKRENFPVRPISPYALQKYAGERYCQIFWLIHRMPTTCLRYFNVFGCKQNSNSQYSAVIPKFIKCFLNNKSPVVDGSGEQSRDFTYVENVVDANLLATENIGKSNGEVFNIACGEQISINKLLDLLRQITGKDITAKYKESRQGDVLHSRADSSKAQNILRYCPKVKFEEGLKKTVNWYKTND